VPEFVKRVWIELEIVSVAPNDVSVDFPWLGLMALPSLCVRLVRKARPKTPVCIELADDVPDAMRIGNIVGPVVRAGISISDVRHRNLESGKSSPLPAVLSRNPAEDEAFAGGRVVRDRIADARTELVATIAGREHHLLRAIGHQLASAQS